MFFSRLHHRTQNTRKFVYSIGIGIGMQLCTASAIAREMVDLDSISVSSQSAKASDPIPGELVLDGPQLFVRQQATTLGGLLDGLPGVTGSWYGPNSNRPVVRGLDGNRVGIFANDLPSMDASSVSFDHNTPINPLGLERVSLLRGPEALLYDGGAVGGVIKAQSAAIPMLPVDGVVGRMQLQGDTGYDQRQGAVAVDAGNGRFAVHADGFREQAGDYLAPGGYSGPSRVDGRIGNSGNRQYGGAIGFSLTGNDTMVGVAVNQAWDNYGVIVDPATRIDMRSKHYTLKGRHIFGEAGVHQIRVELGHGNYQHQELSDGVVATTFRNRGDSARVELMSHVSDIDLRYGLQYRDFDFSALGDEPFLPQTQTRQLGLFGLGKWQASTWSIDLAGRVDRTRVFSNGAADTGIDRFGPAVSRNFTPVSLAISSEYRLNDGWRVTAGLAHNERAPAFDELFANGPHDATGAYEIGSAQLGVERSRTVDVGVRWEQPHSRMGLTGYYSRYRNYIGLLATGLCRDPDGVQVVCGTSDALPEYDYAGIEARFYGLELTAELELYRLEDHRIALELSGELVRADNLTTRQPLPRIAPLMFTPALSWSNGLWQGRLEAKLAARQTRVPTTDAGSETPGYVLVNLKLTRQFSAPLGMNRLAGQWYLAINNLTDRTAFSAGSIDTMRYLAPKPGRSLSGGVQLLF